jgi:uncharacterized protein YdaU (DUF1376 family)
LPRIARGTRFLMEPRAYLSDEAVLPMNLEERGAYSTLLFGLWDLPEPGVAPANDRALAALARATPEEWERVKPAVTRAFDTETRPGWWVQRRMVREHEAQDKRVAHLRTARSNAGKAGNVSRWNKEDSRKCDDSSSQNIAGTWYLVLGTWNKEQTPTPTTQDCIPLPVKDGSTCLVHAAPDSRGAFPNVDIEGELRRMRLWLQADVGRLKTRRGMNRFVVGWLAKAARDAAAGKKGSLRRSTDTAWAQENLARMAGGE